MTCKLCGNDNVAITYEGLIRDGGLGKYTRNPVKMYKCQSCNAIWHDPVLEVKEYYESQEYRQSLEGTSQEEDFYKLHDKESLDKFKYTGTTVFRNGIVADIGCGCGAFLDYVSGVANKIVAIEPSATYREIMDKKGFDTYTYASDALVDYKGKLDVVTSFDVIEHVEDPKSFVGDAYELLKAGGKAVIGTPTETPVMRQLLGEVYEKQLLFSTQHIWILSEQCMRKMAEEIGFSKIEFKYYQRYGIDNLFGWLRDGKPNNGTHAEFITDMMSEIWQSQLSNQKLSDYIVMYLEK